MGMTDRQFEAYQKKTLRSLQRIKEEIETSGNSVSETLLTEIRDLEEYLNRP